MHITGSQKYTHAPENHQIPTHPSRANFYLLCEASQHALINSSYSFLQKLARRWMRWLDSINDSTDMNLSKLREIIKDRCAAVHGVEKSDMT